MAVSASFHRNVLLLTQVITPSDEFKTLFREGMFDKPNTTGFLHVSHYLLTIYNEERFKKLVEWPITCKKVEAKYRNNVKDYLTVIATENQDIGFPNILTSHLFHASGYKFLMIMWKLSQVVLRTYLSRNTTYNIMKAPQMGANRNLSIKLLQEATTKVQLNILKHQRDLLCTEEMAKTALEKESESLNKTKEEIFEKERSIVNLLTDAPVHPLIKKRLADINDEEVIQMWKSNINKVLNRTSVRNAILKNLSQLSGKANGIIAVHHNNTKVDAKEFTKIESSAISDTFPPDVQSFFLHLHEHGKFDLHKFILFFNSALLMLHQPLKLSMIEDFSGPLVHTEASCKDLKTALNFLQTVLIKLEEMSLEMQDVFYPNNIRQLQRSNSLPAVNNVLLMSSPPIKIDTNYSDDINHMQHRLQLTPVEAAHKPLFSRYERCKQNQTEGSILRANLSLAQRNMNDTISAMNNTQQSLHTHVVTPRNRVLSANKTGKYSRLFSSRARKNNRAVNASIMSIPSTSTANSTAIANAIGEMQNMLELSLDITAKSLCDASNQFVTRTELIVVEETEAEHISEMNDVVNSLPIKTDILEKPETIEIEITNNCDNGLFKPDQVKNKRRSIGDLVERYKRLIDSSNRDRMTENS